MMSVMSAGKQVALPTTASTSILPKSQFFPLQVYRIVDDPVSNDVITWDDNGMTFTVRDQERLAREYLPLWFKHNNFPSFVRQLNNYGFSKIRDLQQGILRNGSAKESFKFTHPHFQRGREECLTLIRKKTKDKDPHQGLLSFATPSIATEVFPSQSAIDVHSILANITTIQKHQETISTELKDLKRALWRESMEARERHSKQQDTIDRILKFLAGVFGNHSNVTHERTPSPSPNKTNVPMNAAIVRLMIEDSKRAEKNMSEKPEERSFQTQSTSISPGTSTASSPSPSLLDTLSLPPIDALPADNEDPMARIPDIEQISNMRPVTPPFPSETFDFKIQDAIKQLSPEEFQEFVTSISKHAFDFKPSESNDIPVSPSSYLDFNFSSTPSLPLIDAPLTQSLWQSTDDIDKSIDSVDNGINNLMETLGVDPSLLGAISQLSTESDTSPTPSQNTSDDTPERHNVFFNSFTCDYAGESVEDGPITDTSDVSERTIKGRKRKSDSDLDFSCFNETYPTRSKRRKDHQ